MKRSMHLTNMENLNPVLSRVVAKNKDSMGQKEYDDALKILDDVVAKHPDADLSSAYKYLAYVYNDKLEYQQALDNFEKILPKSV